MTEDEKLRQRIQWLVNSLAVSHDPKQRETLILRLLDTQDQLMTLNTLTPRAPRRLANWR